MNLRENINMSGKVVLITGSTTGIGEAAARRCVADGAHVMIHGLEDELALKVAGDLGAAAGWVTGDLADPDVCKHLVAATVKKFGRIDALVNNAADKTRSTVDTTTVAIFDQLVAINMRAPLLLAQAAVPYFRKQGGGVILNIGSINAHAGASMLLPYAMTKGAMTTMTRNLANTHTYENIRVNQLNPGWVATPMEIALKKREGLSEGWEKRVPAYWAPRGSLVSAEEIAEHILFWVSDRSAPISGQIYEVEQYTPLGRSPRSAADLAAQDE